MNRRGFVLASVLLAHAASCDFTAFDRFRTHTPIVTFLQPENHPSNQYGALVAVASDRTHDTDWMITSAGLGTPVLGQALRLGTTIQPSAPAAQYVCSLPTDCGTTMSRFGVALAGIDAWQDGLACAMTGSFGTVHSVVMRCLGNSPARTFTLPAPAGYEQGGFGLAIAAPRRHVTADPPGRDIVFVGASAGAGRIFAVTPSGTTDLTPMVNGVTAFGSALAVGRYIAAGGTHDLLLAAGSTSGDVLVMHGDPREGRAMQVVGCLARSEPGFGLALTTADLDGDGSDEIVVGSGPAASGRVDSVWVYATAQGDGTAMCGTAWSPVLVTSCADASDRGVQCAGRSSLYGSALAAGDFDGDGRDEVLVGAPHATVDQHTNAGAVFVLHASGTGTALTITTGTILRDAIAVSDARLGNDVRAALIGVREEPLVAVPGSEAVRVYFCSGLPGDRPNSPGLGVECQ